MEESKLYTARVQVVEAMEQGLPWHEAVKLAGLQISQSTAYRLRQRMRQGFHAFGIHLLKLVDVIENGTELAGHCLQFGRTHLQPRQMGYPANVVSRQGHKRPRLQI